MFQQCVRLLDWLRNDVNIYVCIYIYIYIYIVLYGFICGAVVHPCIAALLCACDDPELVGGADCVGTE